MGDLIIDTAKRRAVMTRNACPDCRFNSIREKFTEPMSVEGHKADIGGD
jgi:hypothetical protein